MVRVSQHKVGLTYVSIIERYPESYIVNEC